MKTILYLATSLDGKTTFESDDTSWVEAEDIARMDKLMEEAGVMLMGSNTYRSFGSDLPNDRALQVVVTNNEELLEYRLNNVRFTDTPLVDVLKELEAEGFKKVLIAGGSKLNTSLLALDLIEEIRLIIKPIVIGKGKPIFEGVGEIKNFKNISVEKLAHGAVELIFQKSRRK